MAAKKDEKIGKASVDSITDTMAEKLGLHSIPEKYAKVLATLTPEEQEVFLEKFKKASYESGEAIGIIAAQSISEPATQTTLRAYHLVGRTQLVTTTGLPRLLEIFDARRIPTTPTMEIYLDEEHDNKDAAKEIVAQIKATYLKQLIIEDWVDLLNLKIEVKLDKKRLEDVQISAAEIANMIKRSVKGVEATLHGDSIVIEPKKNLSVKDLQILRVRIRSIHVKGIKGIEQAIVEKKTDENGKERWVIRTLGSNLRRLLKMEGIDGTKTTSNNMYEVALVLGIEAARNSIWKEVSTTMRTEGVETDVRHVLLVADAMTRDGEIKAIGRYGVAGEKPSVLSRANFEETVKHLTTAAAAGATDNLVGIIENIIVGNLAPIGTGLVKLKVRAGKGAARELPEI